MGLFTQVPGETVWKIGMSPETGVPKAAKRDRRGSDRRLLTVQVVPLRGLRLFFPNSFLGHIRQILPLAAKRALRFAGSSSSNSNRCSSRGATSLPF